MKDINISSVRQKTELNWLAGSFCIAFLLNIMSIIIYKTSWSEVVTQLLWVFIITLVLYAVAVAIRLAVYILRRLF
ncbi:MAG: hypothetical protein LBC19_14340 [Tannerella sp.]|nr:hypothetical protein [Tannerella sp.]